MTFNRRSLMGAGLGGLGAAAAFTAEAQSKPRSPAAKAASGTYFDGLNPDSTVDQTAVLQAAIDSAATRKAPLLLPPGVFAISDLKLRAGTRLVGAARGTVLAFAGGDAFVTASDADDILVEDIVFEGGERPFAQERGDGLLTFNSIRNLRLIDIDVQSSSRIGLALSSCSGRIAGITISNARDAGMKALDSIGLSVCDNTISDCGNNGILVWRSATGEDGTIVSGNRITNIRNLAGGTGEYGNGINVFRAGSVLVSNNRVSDCTYSAIRGNSASNIQILGNSCERLGEVALYSEFAFQDAVIANNVVDTAATGISVTNFNEGGRLAVVQGNLIRNLFRREQEPEDKRGEGIGVEADAVITGNTIENAPTVGIQIGWGKYMRDVSATANVIRNARVGISITAEQDAGRCLIASNLISGHRDGAIRLMRLGVMEGPDLATTSESGSRVHVIGNLAV